MDPVETLPTLLSCLETVSRMGWFDAEMALKRIISARLGLPDPYAPAPGGDEMPTQAQITAVVNALLDARFTAIADGLGDTGQLQAAAAAALEEISIQGLTPPAPPQDVAWVVSVAIGAFDDWMSAHGGTDGYEHVRARGAAVLAVMTMFGIPHTPPAAPAFPPFDIYVVSAALRSSLVYQYVSNDDMFLMHVLQALAASGMPPLRQLSEADAQEVLDGAGAAYSGGTMVPFPSMVAADFGQALQMVPPTP